MTIYASEQDRPDVALAREIWRAAQAGLDFQSLVFIDETGTTTNMVPRYGWGRKGQVVVDKAPGAHWMTSTFIAGIQHDGIIAPLLIDCAMNGEIFLQWLVDCLIPEMKPGSIVIADNLPAHKVAGVRQCREDAGMGLLYLPSYSPDFNPIEQVFAKIKALFRRAAARSFDAICDTLNAILTKFSPSECASVHTKSMLGALLDYANVDRERFANAWKADPGTTTASAHAMTEEVEKDAPPQANLFGEE